MINCLICGDSLENTDELYCDNCKKEREKKEET